MAGPARCPGFRPTTDRDCLAAQTASRSLAPAEPAGEAWPARHCQGAAWPEPHAVAGASDVGRPPNGRGTAQAGHCRGDIHSGEVAGTAEKAAIPHVEAVSEDPHA